MKNKLEELRKTRGISQEELADQLEVSRQTIGS
ncbi:MAG: HTH domain-containing protein, partial [Candidatus Izemoplasmatales bacterium]|nr:HTH domain-containing protein [Candidatus Izemoplasmatales bacterium]